MDSDGRLLSLASIFDGVRTPDWIVEINPATGVVTPLIELPEESFDIYYEGIGTNPIDEVTYLFLDFNDGMPQYAAVSFTTDTIAEPTPLEGIQASLGNGYIIEGDFDATGELWFTYNNAGVSRSNGELDVATGATELGDPRIESKAIAVGPVYVPSTPAGPQLAATGVNGRAGGGRRCSGSRPRRSLPAHPPSRAGLDRTFRTQGPAATPGPECPVSWAEAENPANFEQTLPMTKGTTRCLYAAPLLDSLSPPR